VPAAARRSRAPGDAGGLPVSDTSPARGARVCKTIELLPHIKGRWKTKTITLEPWQIFGLMVVFSWVWATAAHADETCARRTASAGSGRATRRSRARTRSRPRPPASRSTCSGPTASRVPRCYSAATTRDQAKIVWSVARRWRRRRPGTIERFGVEVLAHTLLVPSTEVVPQGALGRRRLDGRAQSALRVRRRAPRAQDARRVGRARDGDRRARPVAALDDHDGRLRTARASATRCGRTSRRSSTPCSRGIRSSARRAATSSRAARSTTRRSSASSTRSTTATKWTDPAIWAKANPNLGVSVKLDDIARNAAGRRSRRRAQPNFLTKRLNVWINADSAWMDMRRWDQCADRDAVDRRLRRRGLLRRCRSWRARSSTSRRACTCSAASLPTPTKTGSARGEGALLRLRPVLHARGHDRGLGQFAVRGLGADRAAHHD
jgi:hypothetical protein